MFPFVEFHDLFGKLRTFFKVDMIVGESGKIKIVLCTYYNNKYNFFWKSYCVFKIAQFVEEIKFSNINILEELIVDNFYINKVYR